MPKTNYFENFQAFQHDNLGYKQNLYNLARDTYLKEEAESALASALLFASIADYMGVHLLMSLRQHVKSLSQIASKGVIFYAPGVISGAPLNKLISGLGDFSFPMKNEILGNMRVIKDARNRLFHEMALIDPSNANSLDEDIKLIAMHTESLVSQIDLLYSNFPPSGVNEEKILEDIQNSTNNSPKSNKKK